jgi:L,D-peptidoglycan transpeptidase YkuD (ErfK/YbiS/YcfS/YnhG family)
LLRAALIALLLVVMPHVAAAQTCPASLAGATRLLLVIPASMSSSTAYAQRFSRDLPLTPWRPAGKPFTALLGYRGVAWAHAFRGFAAKGESIKVDGDRRVPAGVFDVGRSFGIAPSRRPGYMRLTEGTVCVDDPRSPAYNTITSRAKVGWRVHGENMWRIPQYGQGLLVDYPTNRAARAGSCIFIHLWLEGATGTRGCVALPAKHLSVMQNFAQGGAVLAVLPRRALARFKGCLPGAVN